jgi:hypothetical protein
MADSSLRFHEYWPLFVRAHENPVVRRVHFAATTTGIGCAVLGAFGRRMTFLLAAPAVALVPTWIARRIAKVSSPLPRHAVFRIVASLKMWGMTLAGTMDEEVERLTDGPTARGSDHEDDDHPHPPPNMVTDHTLH